MQKLIVLLLSLTISTSLFAQAQESSPIPVQLTPWISWVKDRVGDADCAGGNPKVCAWPGITTFTLSDEGGEFVSKGELLSEGEIRIPTLGSLPPHSLEITPSGKIINSERGWFVRLGAGSYELKGKFNWKELPSEIPLPSEVGIVRVTNLQSSSGKKLSRTGDSLRLEEVREKDERQSMSLVVLRRLQDGTPMILDTHLQLSISGGARVVNFGKILPDAVIGVSVESPLAAQISSNGELSVQVKQGDYSVVVRGVIAQPTTSLAFPKNKLAEWPTAEILSFAPYSTFRAVRLDGVDALHADAAPIPPDWKSDAVFSLSTGGVLNLIEESRGELNPPEPTLTLRRDLWLDTDGGGVTASDALTGQLQGTTRLNALNELHIGRASVGDAPLLISKDPVSGESGVELRQSNVSISSVSRIDSPTSFSAVGWNSTVQSINGVLNLPPSWLLLTIRGASHVSGAWLDSWNLLDLFIALLLVIATRKLIGNKPAIILAAVLLVNHEQFLAPRMLIVHILILLAWRLVLEDSKSIWAIMNRVLLWITTGVWVLQVLTFMKLQITQLLFPQLQAGTRYRTVLQEIAMSVESSLLAWPVLLFVIAALLFVVRFILKAPTISRGVLRVLFVGIPALVFLVMFIGGVFSIAPYRSSQYADTMTASAPALGGAVRSPIAKSKIASMDMQSYEGSAEQSRQSLYENKHLAAGPAIPSWRWKAHSFTIPGPVSADSTMGIVALSPTVVRIICGLRVVLLGFLVVLILRKVGVAIPKISPALAALLFVCVPASARADFPPENLLNELSQKISRGACTEGSCVAVDTLSVAIEGKNITLNLKASSNGRGVLAIPGPLGTLPVSEVRIDGRETAAVRRSDEDFLEVLLPNGRHEVSVSTVLPDSTSFSIQLGITHPLFTKVSASGFLVEGVSESGVVGDSIDFSKLVVGASSKKEARRAANSLPHWSQVSRSINLGDLFTVSTTVTRIGELESPTTIKIPLLAGERVTTGSGVLGKGEISLNFGAGESSASFSSILPQAKSLSLEATLASRVSEEWTVRCDQLLRCSAAGLTPTERTPHGVQALRYLPFPGERVDITTDQLAGIEGEQLTVDDARHEVNWGVRLSKGTLTLNLRATRQVSLPLTAPPNSRIVGIQVNGAAAGNKIEGSATSVTLSPGTHSVVMQYELEGTPSLLTKAPAVNVGAPMHNLNVTVTPSQDRWILWTGGGLWGPSVVYWAKLLVVVAFCIALVKGGLLGVSPTSAVLLGIGLSSLPVAILWIPLAWLVSLHRLPSITLPDWKIKRSLTITGLSVLTLFSLVLLYQVVTIGLVIQPPMLITGNGSNSYTLRWFFDHAASSVPQPWVVSLPLWVWRAFSLVWATWLVVNVLKWIRLTLETLRKS